MGILDYCAFCWMVKVDEMGRPTLIYNAHNCYSWDKLNKTLWRF